MGIVDRVTLGSQRVTRKTINSFVGKNNFAWQELRPPSVGELTQGVQQIVTFPNTLITGRASTLPSKFFDASFPLRKLQGFGMQVQINHYKSKETGELRM